MTSDNTTRHFVRKAYLLHLLFIVSKLLIQKGKLIAISTHQYFTG